VIAQLFVGFHATFEIFHHRQRIVKLGVKLCDSLVECVLVEQTFFLQENQGLCHGFEVVFLRPTLVADALALLQLCLNVHQFLNLIGLVCCDRLDGRSKPDVLSECGKHLLFLKLVTEMFRSDKLRSASGQIAKLSTAFLDGDAIAEHKPKVQFKQDAIGKLIDIQAKLAEGKGTGYERWAKKYNLKAMAQTLILLQEKDLLNEDALNQRIAELETKYHDALAVVKDLEGRMKTNKELRYHVAAYTNTKNIAQQLKAAKRPAAFEEQHRAELTAYRAAAAYFKANSITKLPSPKKLEAEYAQLASEKAKFYEQYKEAKEELLKLKTAKQNVASFFREEEPAQQER